MASLPDASVAVAVISKEPLVNWVIVTSLEKLVVVSVKVTTVSKVAAPVTLHPTLKSEMLSLALTVNWRPG